MEKETETNGLTVVHLNKLASSSSSYQKNSARARLRGLYSLYNIPPGNRSNFFTRNLFECSNMSKTFAFFPPFFKRTNPSHRVRAHEGLTYVSSYKRIWLYSFLFLFLSSFLSFRLSSPFPLKRSFARKFIAFYPDGARCR